MLVIMREREERGEFSTRFTWSPLGVVILSLFIEFGYMKLMKHDRAVVENTRPRVKINTKLT